MSDKEKRIGIIGLGAMGERHCQAVQNINGAQLAAVCDLRKEKVEEIKEKYSALNAYTNWEDMIKNEKLDLIIIATNGPTHAPITIASAKAGISRIFCEKPISTSVLAAQEMINVCNENNVRLAVNHLRRWVPSYVKLKKLLDEGVIGEIRHATFEMAGGQLASIGGHFFDLIRFLTGKEPNTILGFIDKTGTPNPRGSQYSDPGGYGLLWMENNIKVFFDLSEDYGVPFYLELMGSVGRVVIDEKAVKWEISARKKEDRDQPFTRRPPLEGIPFEGERIDMIVGCQIAIEELLSGKDISCTGEDGLKSLMMVAGVHCSHEKQNSVIRFPLGEEFNKKEFKFT